MQYAPYGGGTVNYEPNTLASGMPHEAAGKPTGHYHLDGNAVRRRIDLTNDFEQAGEHYRSLSKMDRDHLVGNIVDDLAKANKPIQRRMVKNLAEADARFGKRVAGGLRL